MPSVLDIFDENVTVFGAPGRYVQGPGAMARVGGCAAQLGRRALLLADAQVLPLIETVITESCAAQDVALTVLSFAGALGAATAQDLAAQLPGPRPDCIIAAGGGRAIDAGKALADRLGLRLITMPTVASNDAPTSKNYVLYDANDHLLEVRHLARSPDFVIVDTRLLAGAPRAMFAAGLGDALSKRAEALACAAGQGTTMFLSRPPRLATATALLSHEVLLAHGKAAYDAAGTGQPTPAFEAAVEAMILMAGLGFESGGLSVPHALTRGLPLIAGVSHKPHGIQVAYGLVVHHRLLDESMNTTLTDLYHHAGLPLTLAALAGRTVTVEEMRLVAEASISVRHMLNFPRPLTLADLLAAMQAVEDNAYV